VEILGLGQGTKAYIGTRVQCAAAGALNDTADADADALVVVIALGEVGVDYADVEYSSRIVLAHDHPGKDPTLSS